ncbi:TolC family protein [Mucilaginibacter sp. P25]|uniref:TolC family protein n=1 Tax=Mucilaginibacter sp. P25 TaxID=3423945 RepID=UPI003D7BF755
MRYFLFILLLIPVLGHSQEKKVYSLSEMIALAIHNSASAKLANSTRQTIAWSFENYKATLKPQVVITGSLANYTKEYSKISQDDGSFRFIPIKQNYSNLGAILSQSILATGGDLSLTTNMSRFDDFGNRYKQYSGSLYNLVINQPLFAYNRFKWQKQIEPLKMQEGEKAFVQEMESLSDNIVTYFFDAIEASVNKKLAIKNLQNIQHLYTIEDRRISLGTTTKDKILQLKLKILNSQQDLQKSNVDFKSAVYKLKAYAGIKDTSLADLLIPENLPAMQLSVDQAIAAAKKTGRNLLPLKDACWKPKAIWKALTGSVIR